MRDVIHGHILELLLIQPYQPMILNNTSIEHIHQALANIRLESLEISEQMKELIRQSILDGSINTTEAIERIINKK